MKRALWSIRGIVCLPWCMWDFSRPHHSFNRDLADDCVLETVARPLRRRLRTAWVMYRVRYWTDDVVDLFGEAARC